jgi:A/G-specific adenine glycosylase
MGNRFFTQTLLKWNIADNKRQMPWKGEKNPYKIWLSEIILQQTRVEQGWVYYENFIKKYPTIQKLAKAGDADVFKLWEGLGYYNRCKNLLFTARFITKEKAGKFPDKYENILALKGIGPYTAAAISSFAFNLPYAVVDGNVFRVLSRFFGIDIAIDGTTGKNLFTKLAEKVLDKKNPGAYNQAIMDFGATVCKPVLPLCSKCPLRKKCIAFKEGIVNELPVKEKQLQKKNRWFTYFLFIVNDKILVNKREGKDIWQNLHEFYLVETPEKPLWNFDKIEEYLFTQFEIKNALIESVSAFYSQQLTHQSIKGQFIKINLKEIPFTLQSHNWKNKKQLEKLAFPQFINQYLKSSAIQSNLF